MRDSWRWLDPIKLPAALFLMASAALTWTLFNAPPESATLAPDRLAAFSSLDPNSAIFDHKQLFEHKRQRYEKLVGVFEKNIATQALLCILSVLIFLRRSRSLTAFGTRIPIDWLHLFIPAALMYTWLKFGFVFDDIIETRLDAMALLDSASSSRETMEGTRPIARSLLNDAGIIDGWFSVFVDVDNPGHIKNSEEGTALFLVTCLGFLISASHGTLIGAVAIGVDRYLPWFKAEDLRHSWRARFTGISLKTFAVGLLLASHYQFAFGGANNNWLQPLIGVGSVMVAIVCAFLAGRSPVFSPVHDTGTESRKINVKSTVVGTRIVSRPEASETHPATCRVALLGDSLSTDFYASEWPSTIVRLRTASPRSWFAAPPSERDEPSSLLDAVARRKRAVFYSLAAPGAHLTTTRVDRLKGVRGLDKQVSILKNFRRPPELVIVWIGHNELNWRDFLGIAKGPPDMKRLEKHAEKLASRYLEEMQKLGSWLARDRGRELLICGLVNFQSFFEARRSCVVRKAEKQGRHRHLKTSENYYQSMADEDGQSGMISLARFFNHALQENVVPTLRSKFPSLKIDYLAEFAEMDIDGFRALRGVDAWHPSDRGHMDLFRAFQTSVEALAEDDREKKLTLAAGGIPQLGVKNSVASQLSGDETQH